MTLVHFSTRDTPPELRKELVDQLYNGHVRTVIDFPSDEPVHVEMRLRGIGDVHVAFAKTTPVTLVTPPDEDDLVYISIAGGHGVHDATGDDVIIKPGDINVMRRDRKTVTKIAEPSSCLSIAIPRPLIADRLGCIDSMMRTRSLDDPAADLLSTYAMSLLHHGAAIAEDQQALFANHIVDLAVLLLGGTRESTEQAHRGGARAARRQAIKADIDKHLCDPVLSLEWLARRHRVSVSYVRALFYAEGTSFTDYVMAARLDRVEALLCNPQHEGRTITSLALMAGFGDISWFNQVFRRRFQTTPSDVRDRARLAWQEQPAGDLAVSQNP